MNRVVPTTARSASGARERWLLLTLWAGVGLCALGSAVAAEPNAERAVDVAACIAQLASPQFAQREDAARQLVQAGQAALPPLERAIAHAFAESRGGRNLIAIGMEADLSAAAAIDSLDAVPVLDEHGDLVASPLPT